MKLEIEPIPKSNWHRSLANLLPKPVWDTLRREVYKESDYTCVVCVATGVEVHCHEVWGYDDKRHLQILRGLQCLCEDCHNIKHWGRTIKLYHEGKFSGDYIDRLRRHFCEVNKCSEQDMIKHIVEVGDKAWKRKGTYRIVFGAFNPEGIVEAWKRLKGLKA